MNVDDEDPDLQSEIGQERFVCDKDSRFLDQPVSGGHNSPLHVSIVAIPDAVISTMSGLYDVLNAFQIMAGLDDAIPAEPPFTVEIVAAGSGPIQLASGLPVQPQKAIAEVPRSDIVIVPSVILGQEGWATGRYPELVAWLKAQHDRGALLCSACSGVFLLAETGLFDGRETTIHWEYQWGFQKVFPAVPLKPEQVLIVAGARDELVSSGASNTWHDLVLYLIARFVGPPAAQSVAKFFALQWHQEGLAPYMRFAARRDHGDAAIAEIQDWIAAHHPVEAPVEEMVKRSGLNERTFKRRFTKALGMSPIAYVQRLRIEEAKKRLERTADSVEAIAWAVGYEDPSAFRRLFTRIAGITPAKYRRKFQVPNYG